MTLILVISLVLSVLVNILLAGTLDVAMMRNVKLARDLKMYKDAFSRALPDTGMYRHVKETLESVARHSKEQT